MSTLPSLLIPMIRQRAAAVEQAVADVSDDALWTRPAPNVNPLGNLALHLAGNLMKYIALGVGGRDYVRDRAFEFQATGLPAAEVLERFRAAVDTVVDVLGSIEPASLDEPYAGPEFAGESRTRVLLHSVEHLGYHAGQAVLLAKLL